VSKTSAIPSFRFFQVLVKILSFTPILIHIAASSTVTDDVTNLGHA